MGRRAALLPTLPATQARTWVRATLRLHCAKYTPGLDERLADSSIVKPDGQFEMLTGVEPGERAREGVTSSAGRRLLPR